MDERELILACQGGDEAAFETLIHRYEKRVYTLCRRICRNEDDALEAAQETFLAVWRGIGSFRADAAFFTWLYRLATNACIDLLRRTHDAVPLDSEETYLEPVDPSPTPQEALERSELRRAVREGLAALPDDYREVLVLRELEGLRYDEISAATGLELGTVKSRISRARLALKKYLTEHGNFSDADASKVTNRNRKEADPS